MTMIEKCRIDIFQLNLSQLHWKFYLYLFSLFIFILLFNKIWWKKQTHSELSRSKVISSHWISREKSNKKFISSKLLMPRGKCESYANRNLNQNELIIELLLIEPSTKFNSLTELCWNDNIVEKLSLCLFSGMKPTVGSAHIVKYLMQNASEKVNATCYS